MISIIAAVARNGIIGGANAMPWHITEDLRRFKRLTTGHPVVMGRKTFESIGKPLPGRTNVVITRDAGYSPEGVTVVHSLSEATALFPADAEVFIIGGGEIYRQAIGIADRMYLTWIEADFDGDTAFPDLNADQWEITSEEIFPRGEKFDHPFRFTDYARVRQL